MKDQLLHTAVSIGNAICRDALRYRQKCNWVGVTTEPDSTANKPYHHALKGDWYGGTAGIGYFLANLYQISAEKRHATLSTEAISQSLDTIETTDYGKLGFHTGYTGVAFAAVEGGRLLNRHDLVERGLQLVRKIDQLPISEFGLDVIDGCAGAIPALIRIASGFPDAALDSLLEKMGQYLLEQAQPEKQGISWNTMPHGASANLTGYAHGAAGIATALLELYNYSGNTKYKKAATAGYAYEDSCVVEAQQNWQDFRDVSAYLPEETPQTHCSCTWCHGAPGIGLARLRAYEILQESASLNAARMATETASNALDFSQLNNYSLCHGVFGNAELLLYYSEVTGDPTWKQKACDVAADGMDRFFSRHIPFPNGTQSDFSTPDLMLGQAGMGYALLRMAAAEQFPSILILH